VETYERKFFVDGTFRKETFREQKVYRPTHKLRKQVLVDQNLEIDLE